ncbi:MAG: hypothetical protein MUC36_11425 [Planctomycetes bacterium]|nr:hypothetical protein [Planctomycetota bacterium]
MNAVRILLLIAVASPLLALWPRDQDPVSTDWPKEVERACTSPRYGLRLAAARKVAGGGAASIPAIRAFAEQRGNNALPAALVDAIADDTNLDAPVLQLLREWTELPDFYWRASAMRGLALRAPKVPKATAGELTDLFKMRRDDPSWLMRTHARFGMVLLGDETALTLPEDDPRAKARLSMLLLQQGRPAPLQPLLDALADERTFQGDPWGQRMAGDAHKALKTWLGDAHPLANGGSFPDVATGLRAVLDACRQKSGQELRLPTLRTDGDTVFVGGIELLSCQHGDQFVQWTADGQIHVGIDARVSVRIPAPRWEALSRERTTTGLRENLGVVICDSMRVRWQDPEVHVKIAPAALPPSATNWLKQLAAAIEEAGDPRLAATLRSGLEQFAAR